MFLFRLRVILISSQTHLLLTYFVIIMHDVWVGKQKLIHQLTDSLLLT